MVWIQSLVLLIIFQFSCGQNATSSDNILKKEAEKPFLKSHGSDTVEILGVKLIKDQPRLRELQSQIREMCKFEGNGFPGSQPVAMDLKNIFLLKNNPYRVSWKADGTRYMTFIRKENEVYMFDKANACFEITGIRFPSRNDLNIHIHDTLIDGELVINKINGVSVPTYFVYDILYYNGTNYMKNEYWSNTTYSRLQCIRENIVEPRNKAIQRGLINENTEPFILREKDFLDIQSAKKLIEPEFINSLGHESDGLIFQSSKEPYNPGKTNFFLKWKPSGLSSIDFKLKIVTEQDAGSNSTKNVGHLYIYDSETPFATINVTKKLINYDGKFIECVYENGAWIFLRERTDIATPNSYQQAMDVWETIKNPVTPEYLEKFIEDIP